VVLSINNNTVARLMSSFMGRQLGNIYRLLNACAEQNRYEMYRRQYSIPQSFGFNGEGIILSGSGEIRLGERSYIGRNSRIRADSGTRFVLGHDCRVSYDVYAATSIYNADQIFNDKKPKIKRGDILIGDGCWIGKAVFIREGVSIGDNCVIGAGSVVTHDLSAFSICAGVPCKVLRKKKFEPKHYP
jgi:acetyltransferase-like isoleucine patch superfamily enzyme